MRMATQCTRCGASFGASTCSRYNSDQICMECLDDEKTLATYPACEAAELAAVKAGDYNFHYGLTDEDHTALMRLRLHRAVGASIATLEARRDHLREQQVIEEADD